MTAAQEPAICRLVKHHGGPVATAKAVDVAYQEVQRWVRRGWASPMHILRLEPLLLPGMTIRDLHADRQAAAAEPTKAAA